jgi:hypothetical protein
MYITIDELIGRVANDFNPSEDDWIPRVGQWCANALAELNICPTERAKHTFTVHNMQVIYPIKLIPNDFKLWDCDGCPVPNFDKVHSCDCKPVNDFYTTPNKYYIIGKNNKVLINFHCKTICIENNDPVEQYSDMAGCNVPAIPQVGSLIEAISYYIMWRILLRGSKHPVFNLSNNWSTNPQNLWKQSIEKVKIDVIKYYQDINEAKNGPVDLNNWFYNYTFNPRNT